MNRRSKKRILISLGWVVVICLVVRLFYSGKLPLDAIVLADINFYWLSLALLVTLVMAVISQLRFLEVTRFTGGSIKFPALFSAGMFGWCVNAILLGGGGGLAADAIRGVLIKGTGISLKKLAFFTLVDRGFGLLAMISLSVVAASFLFKTGEGEAHWAGSVALSFNLAAYVFAFCMARITSEKVLCGSLSAGLIVVVLGLFLPEWPRILLISFLLLIAFFFAVKAGPEKIRSSVSKRGGIRFASRCYGFSLCIQLLFACSLLCVFGSLSSGDVEASDVRYYFFAAPTTALTSLVPLPANGVGFGESVMEGLDSYRAERMSHPINGSLVYLSNRVVGMAVGAFVLIFFLAFKRSFFEGDVAPRKR